MVYLSIYSFLFSAANRPELVFSQVEYSRPYSDVAKYIFDIYM